MVYLARGKRGIVHLIRREGTLVAVKSKKPGSQALRALENEAFWLKTLNRQGIGPTFISLEDGNLIMGYIRGTPFVQWCARHSLSAQKRVIGDIFRQCRILDQTGVNKLEMHTPYKHIIVRKGKPVLLDFERCRKTEKPKNVTQFCQFLLTLGYDVDHTALRTLLEAYKRSYDEGIFHNIVSLFVGH